MQNITAPDARLSDLQRRILAYARRRMIEQGQTHTSKSDTETTICLPAPDWLTKALTESLRDVFKKRPRSGVHPWLGFFEEVIAVEKAIKNAMKAADDDYCFPGLTRLYELADGAATLQAQLRFGHCPRFTYHPWPYYEGGRFVFRVSVPVATETAAGWLTPDAEWWLDVDRYPFNCTIPELLRDLYGFPVVEGGHVIALAFSPKAIGEARYHGAQAALRRACDRLWKRKLIVMGRDDGWMSSPYYNRTSIGVTATGVVAADAILEQAAKTEAA